MNRNLIAGMALASVALAGCKTTPETVIVERIVEVKVPVTVPCMSTRPDPVAALRDAVGRDQWDALTTDQRENLIAAQALALKLLGDKLADASAGCQ